MMDVCTMCILLSWMLENWTKDGIYLWMSMKTKEKPRMGLDKWVINSTRIKISSTRGGVKACGQPTQSL